MPLFQKDPDKEQARQQQRKVEEEAKAAAAFRASPQGLARAALEAGQHFFQISLPISRTDRTVSAMFSGATDTKTAALGGQPHVLESIEAEGWKLEHVGYIFQETGSVSRDKLLSSGQTGHVTGFVLGIYLFRRKEAE